MCEADRLGGTRTPTEGRSAVSGLCGPFGTEAKRKDGLYQNLRCKTKNKSLSASTPEVKHHIKENTGFAKLICTSVSKEKHRDSE